MIKLLWSINSQELTNAHRCFLNSMKLLLDVIWILYVYSYQVEKSSTCQNKDIMNLLIKKNWDFKYFLLKILPPSLLFEYRYVCSFLLHVVIFIISNVLFKFANMIRLYLIIIYTGINWPEELVWKAKEWHTLNQYKDNKKVCEYFYSTKYIAKCNCEYFHCCDQVSLFPWFGLHPSVRVGRVPVRKTLGVAAGKGRTSPIEWPGIPWRHQIKSRVLVMATGRRRRGFLCVRLRDLPNVDVGFAKEATRIFEHSLAWVHNVKGSYWSLHLGHVSCLVQQSLKRNV